MKIGRGVRSMMSYIGDPPVALTDQLVGQTSLQPDRFADNVLRLPDRGRQRAHRQFTVRKQLDGHSIAAGVYHRPAHGGWNYEFRPSMTLTAWAMTVWAIAVFSCGIPIPATIWYQIAFRIRFLRPRRLIPNDPQHWRGRVRATMGRWSVEPVHVRTRP